MRDDAPLGIGFVGAGWMGRALLARFAERDDVRIVTLCQRDAARATATRAELGLGATAWTPDYDAVLADPSVDAVVLCTPNGLHGEQALRAMQAGKHVFCEKPCATRYAEFIAQLEHARTRPDLVTMVDYILHFDGMEQRLRELVASGALGTIKQIQVNYRHPVNTAGDKAWKLAADTIGDAIGMGIVHAIWAMTNAMAPQTTPIAVFAHSQPARSRPFEVDPIWTIHVRFANGASGVVLGDIDAGVGYDAYHMLSGTDGAFVFDALDEPTRKVRYRTATTTGDRWVWPLDATRCARDGLAELAWDREIAMPDSGDVWKHQTAAAVAHFVEHVRQGTPSPLSFDATRTVAEIGFAALVSAALGLEVPLPLDPVLVQAAELP